jgi:hypothetical protein
MKEINQWFKLDRKDREMNTQSKSPLSGVFAKIVLAVVLVAGALVILSGLLLNVDKDITVQSRAIGVTTRQTFASLPEYGYIQSHMAKIAPTGKNVPLTGFRALPDYGYIQAHSNVSDQTQPVFLPAGLRSLAISGYIDAHNRIEVAGKSFGDAPLPQGLRDQPISGYIQAHNRMSAETFVAGLPRGLRLLPESGYIQAHDTTSQ